MCIQKYENNQELQAFIYLMLEENFNNIHFYTYYQMNQRVFSIQADGSIFVKIPKTRFFQHFFPEKG